MSKKSKPKVVYTYKSVRREGKRDGRDWRWKFWPPKWPFREPKEPIPPLDQIEPSQYEVNLKEVAEADMQLIAEEWGEVDKKLKPEYCRTRAEYRSAKESFAKESSEAAVAREVFERTNEALNSLPPPNMNPGIMLLFLIIIGLFELPLNSLIFQLFGQGKLETYIMSGVIGLGLPVAAHYMGRSLKQEYKTRTDNILLIISPFIFLCLLGVISFMRSRFFEAEEIVSALGISMSVETSNMVFFVINVAIFFIAMVISYEGSYSNQSKYRDLKKRYKDTVKSQRKESAEEVAAARRLNRAEQEYNLAKQKRKKTFEKFREEAILTQQQVESLITLYRNANMQSRKIAAMPKCFKKPPFEAKIPVIFTDKLEWDCEEN